MARASLVTCSIKRGSLAASSRHEARDLAVRAGVQRAEGEILELPLDLLHTEPVCERRVDLEGLGRDAPLLVLGQHRERAHVVQPVGELDQQHPDVARHRDDHLAHVLRLLLLTGVELVALELRQAVDDAGHLGPEPRLDVGHGDLGVLHGVMEERGLEGRGVEPQIREDARDRDGVGDEILAGLAELALVRGFRERVGANDLARIGPGVVGADLLDDDVDR